MVRMRKDMSILEGDSNPSRTSIREFAEVSSHLCRADLLVYALILCLGAFQFFLYARESDFPGDDVFWADSGSSLIERGFYGINGYPETNMPPGLPAILGVLGAVWGHSPSVFLRAMAVFGTLAFLASYELLRRQVPRIVAAAICLLLMSSMTHFPLVAQTVCPSYPVHVYDTERLIDFPETRGSDLTHVPHHLGSFAGDAFNNFPFACFCGNCLFGCYSREHFCSLPAKSAPRPSAPEDLPSRSYRWTCCSGTLDAP